MANVTGDSPHAVAYALLKQVAAAEKWDGAGSDPYEQKHWERSREEILNTYKACLEAVLAHPGGRPNRRIGDA
jgi:class 3 adenylate cyclase